MNTFIVLYRMDYHPKKKALEINANIQCKEKKECETNKCKQCRSVTRFFQDFQVVIWCYQLKMSMI